MARHELAEPPASCTVAPSLALDLAVALPLAIDLPSVRHPRRGLKADGRGSARANWLDE
jgi:hypothetical protein